MDIVRQRLREVDSFLPSATVSMTHPTNDERKAAVEFASFAGLPLGTLLRRTDAIRLAGGQENFTLCMREAAQHVILRMES